MGISTVLQPHLAAYELRKYLYFNMIAVPGLQAISFSVEICSRGSPRGTEILGWSRFSPTSANIRLRADPMCSYVTQIILTPNQAGEFSPTPEPLPDLEAEMEISESPDSHRENRLMRRPITLWMEPRPMGHVQNATRDSRNWSQKVHF